MDKGRKFFNSITETLYQNEKYRFNLAEIVFLERWLKEANKEQKQKFKAIVDRKQI
jgi:hypothetical protein